MYKRDLNVTLAISICQCRILDLTWLKSVSLFASIIETQYIEMKVFQVWWNHSHRFDSLSWAWWYQPAYESISLLSFKQVVVKISKELQLNFEMLKRSKCFEMSRLWPNFLWPVDPHNDHLYDLGQDLYGLDLVFPTIFSILMTSARWWRPRFVANRDNDDEERI